MENYYATTTPLRDQRLPAPEDAGGAEPKRGLAPHVFERKEDAHNFAERAAEANKAFGEDPDNSVASAA